MPQTSPPPEKKWDHRAVLAGRLIGEAARARRVVLFGSAARGEMNDRSDWDFLVVIPSRLNRFNAEVRARKATLRIQCESDWPAMDILVARESDVERWRDCQYSVIKHAHRRGPRGLAWLKKSLSSRNFYFASAK